MVAKKLVALLLFLNSIISYNYTLDKTDLIIFSYNRPTQLYALLESLDQYVTGVENMHVIYRADDERFNAAYVQVNNSFPTVSFHKQGVFPHQDFKPMVENLLLQSAANYILFAVDDIIVTDCIDLDTCVQELQKTDAYGFYFRLGTNLTECYMLECKQPLPSLTAVSENIHSWTLGEGMYDWGYPNTVDMTLYKKSDIVPTICTLSYRAPNSLEGSWAHQARFVKNRKGLCFTQSKMVNIPVNLTQQEYTNNRNMEGLSTQEMLALFEQGLKIDIAPLHKIMNKSAHMEYVFAFIGR